MHIRALVPIVATALVAAACSGGSSPAGRDGGGEMDAPDGVRVVRLTSNLRFEPSDLVIEPGTTVRWVNETNLSHTVTPDGHAEWQRATTSTQGTVLEHTFGAAGDFEYFCEPHLAVGMTGSIRVE